MNKLFNYILAAGFAFSGGPALATVLEAKPVGELIRLIEASKFSHKEDGLIFGFFSIQSCLYVSDKLVIIKNYCVPARDYPAKGYTIISAEFGIIDLYQEELQAGLKRDVQITAFPEILKEYLGTPMPDSKIQGLNEILEKLYYRNAAACWSTNASYSTGLPVVECSAENVVNFDTWAAETQALTGDLAAWKKLIESIEKYLNQ